MNPGTMPRVKKTWSRMLCSMGRSRIGCENILYKLARIERDIPVRWEFVVIIADGNWGTHTAKKGFPANRRRFLGLLTQSVWNSSCN